MGEAKARSQGSTPGASPGKKPLVPLLLVGLALAGGYVAADRLGLVGTPSEVSVERLPEPDLQGYEPRVVRTVADAERDVRQDPGSAEAWRHLGAVYDAHRMPAEAEVCYAASLELEPDDFWTRYQYAVMREMQGLEPAATIELFRDIEREHPELPQIPLRIGGLLEGLGEFEQAVSAYRRSIEVAPDFPVARRMLGQTLLALDQPAEAVEHLERARSLSSVGDGPTYTALAAAYNQLGEVDKASQFADESLRLTPTLILTDPMRSKVTYLGVDSRTCFERAQFRMSARDFQGALQDLLIAEEHMPEQPYLQLRLASCYAELRQPAQAAQRLERTLELRAAEAQGQDPDAPADDLLALDATISRYRMKYEQPSAELLPFVQRASQLATAGDLDATLLEFSRAAVATELTPQVRLAWARVAHDHGDQFQALEQLDEVVRVDPGNLEAHHLRGTVLEALKRPAEARKSYARAARIEPRHPAAQRLAELEQD